MDALPLELLTLVLSLFPRDRLLRTTSRVCKRWRLASLRAVTAHHFAKDASLDATTAERLFALLPRLRKIRISSESVSSNAAAQRIALPLSVTKLTISLYSPVPTLIAPSLTALTITIVERSGVGAPTLVQLLRTHRTQLRSLALIEVGLAEPEQAEVSLMHFPSMDSLSLNRADIGYALLERHATQLTRLRVYGAGASLASLPLTRLADLCLVHSSLSPLLLQPSLRALHIEQSTGTVLTPLSDLRALVSYTGRAKDAAQFDPLPHLRSIGIDLTDLATLRALSPTSLTRVTRLLLWVDLGEDAAPLWEVLGSMPNLTSLTLPHRGRLCEPHVQCAPRRRPLALLHTAFSNPDITYDGVAEELRWLIAFFGGAEWINVPLCGYQRNSDPTRLCDLAYKLTRAGVDFSITSLADHAAAEMLRRCEGNPGRVKCPYPWKK